MKLQELMLEINDLTFVCVLCTATNSFLYSKAVPYGKYLETFILTGFKFSLVPLWNIQTHNSVNY